MGPAKASTERTAMKPPAPKPMGPPSTTTLPDGTSRRSSSRSIKRKRFDDEIVEYCLNSQQSRDTTKAPRSRKGVGTSTVSTTVGTAGASGYGVGGTAVGSAARANTKNPTHFPPPRPILPPAKHVYLPTLPSRKSASTPMVSSASISTSSKPSTMKSSMAMNKSLMPAPIPPPPSTTNVLRAANTRRRTRGTKDSTTNTVKEIPTQSTSTNAKTTTLGNELQKNNNSNNTKKSNTNTNRNNSPSTVSTATMQSQSNSERKRNNNTSRSTARNRKTKKSGKPHSRLITGNLGRWKPADDLALIIDVLQTKDLRTVHRGTKFSCKFTLSELHARWYSLLYEPAISRIALTGLRNLHPESVKFVQRKALFSDSEEEILAAIKSTENPKLARFREILNKHSGVFHCFRTPKILQTHWQRMREFHLLNDQIVKPLYDSDQPLAFSDAEDIIMDTDLLEQRDEALEMELALADRKNKTKIRILENELHRWNVLVESVLGIKTNEFDGQTLAALTGRFVRFLMRSKEITFGREGKGFVVDVDMSLEGPAMKISRRQGTIKLRSNGDFFVSNEGKRSFFVDGVPLLPGNKTRLSNNCTLEVCHLTFIFLVNHELISAIQFESAKTTAALN